MTEKMIDALPYIAIVLAVLAFVLYKYMKHRESEFKAKKQAFAAKSHGFRCRAEDVFRRKRT